MEQRIIEILNSSKKHSLTVNEIAKELDVCDFQELLKTLIKLEEDELVFYDDVKQSFCLPQHFNLRVAKLAMHKRGFAFAISEGEEDVFISKSELNGATHDDIVWVRITGNKENKKQEGTVIKIIQRGIKKVVGEFTRLKRGDGRVIATNSKIVLPIHVNKKDSINCVSGHNVIVLITEYHQNFFVGKVIEVIGHKNDPGIDILTILKAHDVKTEFDQAVLDAAHSITEEVSDEEREKRVDLTKQVIITIDGDDAKDLDDAISIRKDGNGYMLGVHIADVSYYVRENDVIDKEAYERGTSVYVADRVVPMLPHVLSNGVCSLNPRVERLTISCEMNFDYEGNLTDYRIFPAIIKTTERMTYRNVNKIIDDNNEETKKEFKHIYKELKIMQDLALILRKRREERGAIDFDTKESKIVVDENGKPVDVVLRTRGAGERLIEDFMIAANECIAAHFHGLDIPFMYRIHETPDPKKLRGFAHIASLFNLKIKGSIEDVKPKLLQTLIADAKEIEEAESLPTLLLRCMKKAVYDSNCVGHYGLASTDYTHFTSPIRRYPDLIVHRLIRKYVFDNDLSNKTINHYQKVLPAIALQSSERERRAVEAERDVDDMKKAEYMQDYIGSIYDGRVSGVTNFGLFVELENTIEGLVSIQSLPDYFIYDEAHLRLVGQHTKKTYKMGDKVKVKLIKADKNEGQIDFEIIGEKNEKNNNNISSNNDVDFVPRKKKQDRKSSNGQSSERKPRRSSSSKRSGKR